MAPAEYYQNSFKDRKNSKFFIKWNWSAFLFTSGWLAYRKMYAEATIVVLALLAIVAIMFTYFPPHGIGLFFEILSVRIILGLIGTSLYYRKWLQNPISHHSHTTIAGIIIWSILINFIVFLIETNPMIATYLSFPTGSNAYNILQDFAGLLHG